MSIKEIVNKNNIIYNKLATEYNKRMNLYISHQQKVINPFIKILEENFNNNNEVYVLDVGCGVGLDLKLISKNGFKTYGIDYSSNMAEYARLNSKNSNIINSDFIEHDFEILFHGVIMDAFIHLFPKNEIGTIFRKLYTILLPSSFAFISTTKHQNSKEGYYKKGDYKTETKRYRAYWTNNELESSIKEFGFIIVDKYEDYEVNFNKRWMNFIIQKP